MSELVDRLAEGVLVCDGAMGTMLHAAGNSLDRALPELNLTNAKLVSTVHESYISAGVDVILTNTFGAGRLRLTEYGASASVRDINLAGVRIARAAQAAARRPVFVAGSVSPAVTAGQRRRTAPADRVAALREQVEALAEGGVDVLVFETFGYLGELVEAVEAAAGLSDLPIIAQATFTADGCTLGGETPREVAAAMAGLPVIAVGTNCTLGPQGSLAVVAELRGATSLPVSVQPNAGLPRRTGDRRFEYHIDGDYFARYAGRYVEAGASLVGGCCGTTPTHIAAAAARIAEPRPRRPRPAAPRDTGSVEPRSADWLTGPDFVVAAEVVPPTGGATDEVADTATELREHGVHALVVAPGETARAQPSSINLALHLRQRTGIETVATATTWDKTIMSLQADLLGAHALGLRTVVCETGNPPLRGDYPNVDGIWEVDSIGLIGLLAGLNTGRDCNGLTLATKTAFHIGARFNPGAENVPEEVTRIREKIDAGARFLISRPVYELATVRRILDALADEDLPVLLEIAPLSDFAEAEFLSHEVPDVTIPDATLRAMERAGADAPRTGLELAGALLREARGLARGVVLRVSGTPGAAAALLDA
jgi:homocysteine S-methyltransferase